MPARRPLLFLLFTASGFAGLIYESLWSHYLKLFLGHAAYAQTLVLALFMGGMAIGAWIVSRRVDRWRNMLRGYAYVEALIGLSAIWFHEIFQHATNLAWTEWLPQAPNEFFAHTIKWSLAAALILPQSVLLGMTFPLMSGGLLRRHPEQPGESISLLYFTNSLGAAAGVLVSGFILVWKFGLPGSMQIAGYINLALAVMVWMLAPGRDRIPQHMAEPRSATEPAGERFASVGILLLVAAFTGAASFIYEIAWIRMLSVVLGASTHSFELMLSAFILGLALGGLWIRWRIDRLKRPLVFLAVVQVVMGLLALSTLVLYDYMFDAMQAVVQGLARTDSGYILYLAASHGIALTIMLPATFCAGMTLPLITWMLLRGDGERSIGRVYAANTAGSIAGVAFAAQIGMPWLGVQGLLITGASLDVLLGILLLWHAGARMRLPVSVAIAAGFAAIAINTAVDPLKMASGVFRRGEIFTAGEADVVYYRDGKTTSVALLRFNEDLSLRTNGKSDGAINMSDDGPRISDEMTMVLTAALPLAHRPDAKDVAIIGIGTGLTTHTMAAMESVERVETIEIEPFMAEASRRFAPRNANAFADPKSVIVFDDAKTHFSTANRKYDIIVSEPSNPWVSGVSSLFTREFYRHVKRYLKPGGILTQWFQLYEITPSLVASVMAALGEEFEDYAVYSANDGDLLIVAGERDTFARPLADIFSSPGLTVELRRVHIGSIGDIELRRIGGKSVMAPFFATWESPANSDFRPYLDLRAARHRFMQSSARDLTQIGQDGVPVVSLVEGRSQPARNPTYLGEEYLLAMDLARRGAYARDFLLNDQPPEPRAIPMQVQKDLELLRLRGIDCHDPERFDVWRQSAYQIARLVNSTLPPAEASAVWKRVEAAPCSRLLTESDRDWIRLYAAIAARDGATIAQTAMRLLDKAPDLRTGQVQYLLTAGMAGHIANKDLDAAVRLWNAWASTASRAGIDLNLRLLFGQLAAAGKTETMSPTR